MPAHAPAPRGTNRHARRAQGGATTAATSIPRPRPRLLWLGLMGVLVLCLQGFSPSAWVAPAVAQGTLLINEPFTGTSVSNPDFTVHGSTCLTGASGLTPGAAQIQPCTQSTNAPVPGMVPGYLQFTDAQDQQAGDILYNRPIPATAGLIVAFDQWQYGGTGADGISFFLVHGAAQLTQTGGKGGSLGYAQHNLEVGIQNGVLGLGLDAFGNYYNDNEDRGTGCELLGLKPPFPTTGFVPDAVTLRGPGHQDIGFCYLGSTTETIDLPSPHPESNLPGSLRGATLATLPATLAAAKRSVRITVQPDSEVVPPHVIVEIDFHDGEGLQRVLDVEAPPNLPETYKFGWAGSTGAKNDVHLLGNVVVSTVVPLNELNLVKQLDQSALPDPLVKDSVVRYQFVVTNGGLFPLTGLRVQDTRLSMVSCPTTTLLPASAGGSSVVCTGDYILTQADVDAGGFTNTATATAFIPGAGAPVISNQSSETLVVGMAPHLALKKFVVDPPPYRLGQPVTFRYHLINEGNVTLTNPRVTDDKFTPTELDKVACIPFQTFPQPPLRSAPAFRAAAVCTGTHVLQASDLDADGVFTNTAVGSATAPGGTQVSSDFVSLSLPVGTDIAVTKRVDRPLPSGENLVTYTVTATNQGVLDATGVQLSDPIAVGTTFVAATPTPGTTYDPATGLWTIGNLARDASVTLVLQVRVTTLTPATNVARLIAVDQFDINPANNEATADPTIADIAVTKTVNQPTPRVGETVTYTVTVLNRGPSPATGVQLVDGLVDGLTLLTATPSQGTYTATTGVWDVGPPVAVGATATLLLTVRVEQEGPLRNLASKIAGDQHDPNRSNNFGGVDLTGQPSADIQVHKAVDNAVPPVGSSVTFTVTVTNAGPSAATGVQLTDRIPADLRLLTATPSQGMYTAETGVWDVGAMAFGAQVTLVVQAIVTQPGPRLNTVAKTAQGESDPVSKNDASGVIINGQEQEADVQVVKTVHPTSQVVGQPVTFRITVTNNGPSAATGVEVLDMLSERLTFVSAIPSQGTYTAATGRWSVGALAAVGAAATATLQVTATVTQAGPLTNLAVKIAQDQPDLNRTNDHDSIAPSGLPVADLVVTKSHGGDSIVPGTEVTYTVVVTNRGPSAVTGATVSDPMPLLLVDAPPARRLEALEGLTWVCMPSAGSVCPMGGTGDVLATVDLPVGGTTTFTIRGRVVPAVRGTLVNTATVTAPEGVLDPLQGNNSATDPDRLMPVADLSITKTDGVESVVSGTIIRYTLVVRNAGPSAAIGALVQDPESATLQGVSWTCVASSGSSCLAAGIGPIATTVNLAPGGTVTFTLTGTVTAEATGTLANTATVTAPPAVTDPELRNNTVTDTNAVTPPRNAPSGRKTVSAVDLPDLEWRVVWLNPANAEPPLRIRMLDPIPTATTYVDGSVTCEAHGVSTVERCDFDAATNEIIYDGIIGPDPGATTEEKAVHAVVITFRTTVLPGVIQVANQALAHWDENGNGVVDDDIRASQVPVQTGVEFRQSDPTVATLPPLACLFQQRLLALTGPAGGGPTDTAPTDGQDAGADAGVDRQSAPGSGGVFTLSTPLDSDTVAGTTVALAALQVPVSGTVVSQPAEILIANGVSEDTLDLVENVGRKTERVPAGAAHDVVTADGVVGELSATALAAADILRLDRVAPTTAPAPLPGVAVSPLVALTLASGRTAFSSPVTLSLPYPDADQDGLVDELSPALLELTLTAWIFDAASQRWLPLPEARVFTAFNELRVATTQTGLYGVFQATDGSTGLAGTSAPAAPGPRSATAQGLGWQDIGVVTTFPFLVPLNTTTLPNGTYALRAVCTTNAADLSAAAGNSPAAASVLRTSGGSGGGGGGCSLRPEGGWSRATALDAAGNLGVPLVVLLVLGLWVWRRPR